MLHLCAFINQSSIVYADANTARLSLCPYQLKESGQQSIIRHVTRHVVCNAVCATISFHICVFVFNPLCMRVFSTVHDSLLNTLRHPDACVYFHIYKERQK